MPHAAIGRRSGPGSRPEPAPDVRQDSNDMMWLSRTMKPCQSMANTSFPIPHSIYQNWNAGMAVGYKATTAVAVTHSPPFRLL